MRTKFLLLFACWTLCLSAKHIPVGQARKMAMEFFQNNRPQLAVNSLQMVYDGETSVSRSEGANPALYVFNNPKGKGFVIISGDDISQPVLGYSYENNFPMEHLPEHLEAWLKSLKTQIEDGRKYGAVSSPISRNLSRTGEAVVQLETAQWNQHSPYNKLMPTIGGKVAPTGCTVTAGAIIMKFHEWPKKGNGTLPAYTTKTMQIKMPAIKLGHTYEWDKMLNVYKSNQYTKEQEKQVARLMADIGTMITANYNKESTSASTSLLATNLPIYMDYDKSALHRNRHEYDDANWHKLLMTEIREKRPVIYTGHNEDSGHAFILDGYTSDYFYSVNWGWGGSYNGFFLLNALEPKGHGTGGNGKHYNFKQTAITGLMPNRNGDYIERIGFGENGLSTNVTEFEQYIPFEVIADRVNNQGGSLFSGTILWALTDKDGNIKEELATKKAIDLKPRYGWNNLKRECTITVPIEIGDRIRLFYRNEKSLEWNLITGGENCTWELFVADQFTIDESTSIRRNRIQNTIVVTTKEGVSVEWVSTDGHDTEACYKTVGKVTTIQTQNLPAGVYLLKLKKKTENREVRIKLGNSSE